MSSPVLQDSIALNALLLTRLLGVTAHNLDLVRWYIILIIELEIDVFDKECPDFIAKAIGIEVALHGSTVSHSPNPDAAIAVP